MPKIMLYYKPTCSTCREAYQLLKESGQEFEAIDYYKKPFTLALLRGIVARSGLPVGSFLRKKETFAELRLGEKEVPPGELLKLMIKHPDLIQRPIAEKGKRVLLARPAEKVKELL